MSRMCGALGWKYRCIVATRRYFCTFFVLFRTVTWKYMESVQCNCGVIYRDTFTTVYISKHCLSKNTNTARSTHTCSVFLHKTDTCSVFVHKTDTCSVFVYKTDTCGVFVPTTNLSRLLLKISRLCKYFQFHGFHLK